MMRKISAAAAVVMVAGCATLTEDARESLDDC
jgi:hypothetical protein